MKGTILTAITILFFGYLNAQTKAYHAIGLNVGTILKSESSIKNIYVQPEYEVSFLKENGSTLHGFVTGVCPSFRVSKSDLYDSDDFFIKLKGGYKINIFAFGASVDLLGDKANAGAWFNFNVSQNSKIQLSYSNGGYTSFGFLMYPKFLNK